MSPYCGSFQTLAPCHPRVFVFTDGSCSKPSSGRSSERKATWAFRRAYPHSDASELMCAGILPRRKQTAFRSELFAVLCALLYAHQITVFSDCQGVVSRFQKLITFGWCETTWRSSPDLDLWCSAWKLLQREGCSVDIRWTPAHRKTTEGAGVQDLWEIVNNSLTDKAADHQRRPWPAHIQPAYDKLFLSNHLDTVRKTAVDGYIRRIWDLHEDCDAT